MTKWYSTKWLFCHPKLDVAIQVVVQQTPIVLLFDSILLANISPSLMFWLKSHVFDGTYIQNQIDIKQT